MKDYQHDFLGFAAEIGALRFGTFTLKSGRQSPYFFNAGLFNTGARLDRLASAYAQCIQDANPAFDVLFGPAYKGIPLAAATSIALSRSGVRDVAYAFNRKEAKDHGEGGLVVGSPLVGRILVIDDVITAGTSVHESMRIIQEAGAEPAGVVIALDRQEQGQDGRSAIAEVTARFGIPVLSLVTLSDLIQYLEDHPAQGADAEAVRAYRDRYGVASQA
ncbi:orotate phosphoribosyltransferase [Thiocapsa imhoffii]|uniref:Orotate phosphoribosyltransferase n=1 Tax=Thiocapsa imhoffii TaxID=382777 RepID=A0A9X0WEU0_9GAMM|nr:orotate phosphoribosyltransferase [Thiocapsa imhoffii]MBK1643258.1 orotate phosphoribosyltransferase [Thiocapsa imhoffii]